MEVPAFDPEHDVTPELTPEKPYPVVPDRDLAAIEVANSPVGVRHDWTFSANGAFNYEIITATLPYGCEMQGGIDDTDSTGRRLYNPGFARVNPELRELGIAGRLIEASLAYAVDHGATDLSSVILNEYSMRIMLRLLGDRIRFYDYDPRPPHPEIELPITAEQAVKSLVQAGLSESNPEDRQEELHIRANLDDLDVSEWERPLYQT